MEQVSRIALAILARGIAAMNTAVGDDLRGRNDIARGERCPEPVNDLGRGDPSGFQVMPAKSAILLRH